MIFNLVYMFVLMHILLFLFVCIVRILVHFSSFCCYYIFKHKLSVLNASYGLEHFLDCKVIQMNLHYSFVTNYIDEHY